jgi:protein subunit release factor B
MEIPRDRVSVSSSRSGGPGGQNVNKVSTKVEIRFRLEDADWIPPAVRERLAQLEKRRINRDGDLVVVSCRYRQQNGNLEDCFEKLGRMIDNAAVLPVPRIRTRPTRSSRRRRLQEKQQRSRLRRERSWTGEE